MCYLIIHPPCQLISGCLVFLSKKQKKVKSKIKVKQTLGSSNDLNSLEEISEETLGSISYSWCMESNIVTLIAITLRCLKNGSYRKDNPFKGYWLGDLKNEISVS